MLQIENCLKFKLNTNLGINRKFTPFCFWYSPPPPPPHTHTFWFKGVAKSSDALRAHPPPVPGKTLLTPLNRYRYLHGELFCSM